MYKPDRSSEQHRAIGLPYLECVVNCTPVVACMIYTVVKSFNRKITYPKMYESGDNSDFILHNIGEIEFFGIVLSPEWTGLIIFFGSSNLRHSWDSNGTHDFFDSNMPSHSTIHPTYRDRRETRVFQVYNSHCFIHYCAFFGNCHVRSRLHHWWGQHRCTIFDLHHHSRDSSSHSDELTMGSNFLTLSWEVRLSEE